MSTVTTDAQLTEAEIRLQECRDALVRIREQEQIELERRDTLIVRYVDQGLPETRAAKASGVSATRVRQILGGG